MFSNFIPVNDPKSVDFLYYSDSDEEDIADTPEREDTGIRVSCNFSDVLKARETGCDRRFMPGQLSSEHGTRHMLSNSMLKEYPIIKPGMNKVFCSQWLSHRQLCFGTKCNKVSPLIG